MTKKIYTGIKDRNGVKVFTGDIVTMHYFGLGIGELGGAIEAAAYLAGYLSKFIY